MEMTYETPQFMPLSDLEMSSVNGGTGVPVVVFILVAAVTVVAAAFIVAAGVGWAAGVGTTALVSTSTITKS
jgi:hypothetical protein